MEAQPRINERCPACGFQTLAIDFRGFFICTWLSCPAPSKLHDILKCEEDVLQNQSADSGEEPLVERRGWDG